MAELNLNAREQTPRSMLLFPMLFSLPIIFQRRKVKTQKLACNLTRTVFLQEED